MDPTEERIMSDGPRLPDHVTADRIEQYLDRIAIGMAHSKNPEAILPWYQFLELELQRRRGSQSSLRSALARAKRLGSQVR